MELRDKKKLINKTTLKAFVLFCCCLLAFFLLFKISAVAKAFQGLVGVLMPFIWGFVFAFLASPFFNWCMRLCDRYVAPKLKTEKLAITVSKVISTTASVLLMLLVIVGIVWLVVPGIVSSATALAEEAPGYAAAILDWVDKKALQNPQIWGPVQNIVSGMDTNVWDLIKNFVLPHSENIISFAGGTIMVILIALKNVLIGLVAAAYMLAGKEKFLAGTKRIIVSVFREAKAKAIFYWADYTHKAFSGFIIGKLLSSCIVGIITFLVMICFGWPYAALITAIIAITNIIPTFGPFIGTPPCLLLLLLEDPKACIFFLGYIVIIQMLDGNVITPKIVGDSVGISGFWIIFAVLVGGSLFGFVGMIVGIPVFAVLYAYCNNKMAVSLGRKGRDTGLDAYVDYDIYKYKAKEKNKDNTEEK